MNSYRQGLNDYIEKKRRQGASLSNTPSQVNDTCPCREITTSWSWYIKSIQDRSWQPTIILFSGWDLTWCLTRCHSITFTLITVLHQILVYRCTSLSLLPESSVETLLDWQVTCGENQGTNMEESLSILWRGKMWETLMVPIKKIFISTNIWRALAKNVYYTGRVSLECIAGTTKERFWCQTNKPADEIWVLLLTL